MDIKIFILNIDELGETMENKLVSVIIPVYNADDNLYTAIDSILGQTYKNIEVIVVNDGSRDEGYSQAIIDEYGTRIKAYQKVNGGIADALNYGIGFANGEFIARMDQDDVSFPDRIEKQVAFLNAHEKIDICGTQFYFLKGNNIELGSQNPCTNGEIVVSMIFSNCLCHPSVMMRASVLQNGNIYDKNAVAEDYEFWLRNLCGHKMANLPEKLLLYRIWDNNFTISRTDKVTEFSTLIIRKTLKEKLNIDDTIYPDNIINVNYGLKVNSFFDRVQYVILAHQYLNDIMERCVKMDIATRTEIEQAIRVQWIKYLNISEIGYYLSLKNKDVYEFDRFCFIQNELKMLKMEMDSIINGRMNIKVVICGVGRACNSFLMALDNAISRGKITIVGFADNMVRHYTYKDIEYDVTTLTNISDMDFDYAIISSAKFFESLKEDLLGAGIEEERIWDRAWARMCLESI